MCKKCSCIDSSRWVSDLDPGAEALLSPGKDSRRGVPSFVSLVNFLPVTVPLCSSGPVEVGLCWADGPSDGLGGAQHRVPVGIPWLPLSMLTKCSRLSRARVTSQLKCPAPPQISFQLIYFSVIGEYLLFLLSIWYNLEEEWKASVLEAQRHWEQTKPSSQRAWK